MERKFRVLKDMKVNVDVFTLFNMNVQHNIQKDSVLKLSKEYTENGFIKCNFIYNIGKYEYDFHVQDLKAMIQMGYLEEILPNKSLISSSEKEIKNMNLTTEDIYDKKHNIFDTMMLLEKMPKGTLVMNEHDEFKWYLSDVGKNLFATIAGDTELDIMKQYDLLDLLYMTFTFIKPQEEKIEKWREIKTAKDLAHAVVSKKKIKVSHIKGSVTYNSLTDFQIDELFRLITHSRNCTLEYLED